MGRPNTGVQWRPHQMAGEIFNLGHLHPYKTGSVVAPKGSNPERRFRVQITFGLHCFTKTPEDGTSIPEDGWYADKGCIWQRRLESLAHARHVIGQWIRFYKNKRQHQPLGYAAHSAHPALAS